MIVLIPYINLLNLFLDNKMSIFEGYGAFKILSGMANSADPDQTAPSGAVWSGSALFAYVKNFIRH